MGCFKDAGYWCDEHGYDPAAPTAIIQGSALPEVRFKTAATESAAGIQTVPVTDAAMGTRITMTARIDFNRNAGAGAVGRAQLESARREALMVVAVPWAHGSKGQGTRFGARPRTATPRSGP